MKKQFGTIYIIKNKVNGKLIVGQTKRKFEKRLREYIKDSQTKLPKSLLSRAIKKYGIENFEIIKFIDIPILQITPDKSVLDYFEIELIRRLKSNNRNYGYNLESGGLKGKIVNKRTKKNQSKKAIERLKNKENHPMFGKKQSEESKEKNRQSQLKNNYKGKNSPNYGKHPSKESIEKISRTRIEKGIAKGKNNPNYGNYWTQKQKENSSKKMIGKNKGKDHYLYGIHRTEEEKEKISKSLIGRYKGKNNPNSKSVICLNNLEIFNSISEAMIKYKIIGSSSIGNCCKGKRNYSGKDEKGEKLVWAYYDDYLKMS